MPPLVSIVITTFNQAPWLGATLSSALRQTYPNFELIVIDDGSVDDTARVASAFESRIRYFRRAHAGIAASRNAGVRQARGEFVALLDGDDLWEPDKLSVQVAAAHRYPDAGMLVADGVQFGGDGILGPSLLGPSIRTVLEATPDPIISGRFYDQLLEQPFISTVSQVMIRTDVLRTVGESATRFRLCSDYDLYLRIAARHPMTIIRQRLVSWRYSPTSASGPARLRHLYWGAETIQVWKTHLRQTAAPIRRRLVRQIQRLVTQLAQEAYYLGRRSDRRWALVYLLRLTAATRAPSAALFLLALVLPETLAADGARFLRKVPSFQRGRL